MLLILQSDSIWHVRGDNYNFHASEIIYDGIMEFCILDLHSVGAGDDM